MWAVLRQLPPVMLIAMDRLPWAPRCVATHYSLHSSFACFRSSQKLEGLWLYLVLLFWENRILILGGSFQQSSLPPCLHAAWQAALGCGSQYYDLVRIWKHVASFAAGLWVGHLNRSLSPDHEKCHLLTFTFNLAGQCPSDPGKFEQAGDPCFCPVSIP